MPSAPATPTTRAAAEAATDRAARPLRGVALMLGASLCYAGMSATVKLAAAALPSFVVVLGRSLIVLAVAWSLARVKGVSLRATNRRWIIARSLFGFAAMCCYFYALSVIPLAEAVTLQFTSPLFVALLAAAILGERLDWRTICLIALAFVGAAMILAPDLSAIDGRAAIALLAAALAGVSYIAVRRLRSTDAPETIVYHFALFSVLFSTPALLWVERVPSPLEAVVLLAVGLFATGGQILMTHAYRHASAAFISAFSYATVLFSALLGVVAFNETPSLTAAIGAALIIISGVGASLARDGGGRGTDAGARRTSA